MKTRLQVVAMEFIIADEALRKSLLKVEQLRRKLKLYSPSQPKRIEVMGKSGKEIWSLPIR